MSAIFFLYALQVFDHLNQRNEKLTSLISRGGKAKGGDADGGEGAADGGEGAATDASKDGVDKVAADNELKEDGGEEGSAPGDVDKEVRELNAKLQKENASLHRLNTSLHERNHFLQLKYAEFEERIAAEETRKEELQNKVDDLEYELTRCRMRNGKLETSLAETQEKLKMYVDRDGGTCSIDRRSSSPTPSARLWSSSTTTWRSSASWPQTVCWSWSV